MRKFICSFVLLFFMFVNISIINVNAVPNLNAEGVVLIDAKSGDVLYSKNQNTKYLPASTTKVMTAILVLENCKLDEEVTVGKNPPYAEGSSLGIREGEVYTVEELLIGLLLSSGNDTAEALAEYVSGSVEEFAKLMTKKAHEIGATNTTFTNPHGLDEKTQNYTTPYDLALIMKEAIKNEDFIRISKMDSYKYETKPYTDGTERWAVSSNRVMRSWSSWYYPHVIAGKTGYTDAAKHSYVAVAEKNGQLLIASFLKAENKDAHYSSVGPLFEYGFNNFKTIEIVKNGDIVSEYRINDNITLPLIADKDYYITKKIDNNLEDKIKVEFEEQDISKKEIKKGDKLFNGSLILNGEKIHDITLLSGADREYNKSIARKEALNSFLKNKPLLISCISICIILLLIVSKLYFYNKKQARLKKIRKRFNIK